MQNVEEVMKIISEQHIPLSGICVLCSKSIDLNPVVINTYNNYKLLSSNYYNIYFLSPLNFKLFTSK